MKALFKRFIWRVLWSMLFTVGAFSIMQPLALATGVPEVARVLPALAVLYWLDLSLMIGRVIMSPGLDSQSIHLLANPSVVAVLLTLSNLFRLGALLWIIYAT